jgi:hypothetical protein
MSGTPQSQRSLRKYRACVAHRKRLGQFRKRSRGSLSQLAFRVRSVRPSEVSCSRLWLMQELSRQAHRQPPNQRLERTVIRDRGDAASAPLHYALASRIQAASRGRSTARYAS